MWNRNHNSIPEEFVFHIYLCAMWISEETKGNITNNEAIFNFNWNWTCSFVQWNTNQLEKLSTEANSRKAQYLPHKE